MSEPPADRKDEPTPHRLRWWIAASACTGAVLAGASVFLWWWLSGTVWTDGAGIARHEDAARIRQVLWAEPDRIFGLVDTTAQEYEPALSPDGKELYFVRGLPGRYGPQQTTDNADIYMARQTETGWSDPAPLARINTEYNELGPRLTPDGKWLLLYSDRPGGQGGYDIWASRRTEDGWAEPINLGPNVNSPHNDYSPAPAPDGRLFLATNRQAAERRKNDWHATVREGEIGDYDLFLARPFAPGPDQDVSEDLAYEVAEPLAETNTPHHEGACCVSPAGDFLYFASNRPGGHGGFDLYRLSLRGAGAEEGPANLGPEINTGSNETDPELTDEGFTLLFSTDRAGRQGTYELYRAVSREVFAQRRRRDLPGTWAWWLLAIALAVLVPAMLFLKAIGYEHLSALQKAIAASVLLHILLTVLLSLLFVSQDVIEYAAEKAGLIDSVSLEMAPEAQAKMEIRESNYQLPVQDPRRQDLRRAKPTPAPRAKPPISRANEPEVPPAPAEQVQQPVQPELPPPDAGEQIHLPDPPQQTPQPEFRPPSTRRVAETEDRPESPTDEPPEIAARQDLAEQADPRRPDAPAQPVPPVQAEGTIPAPPAANPDPVAIQIEQPDPDPAPILADPEVAPRAPATRLERLVEATDGPEQPAENSPRLVKVEASSAPDSRPRLHVEAVPPIRSTEDFEPTQLPIRTVEPPVEELTIRTDLPEDPETQRIEPAIQSSPERVADSEPAFTAAEELQQTDRLPGPLSRLDDTDPSQASEVRQIALDAPATDSVADLLLADDPTARPADELGEVIRPVATALPEIGALDPGRLTSPLRLRVRSFPQRQELIRELGGSEKSEAAVAKALAWLARTQEDDGRWKYKKDNHHGRPDMALTGLAALCYLASDHHPGQESLYCDTVTRAVKFLVENQKNNGDLRGGGNMYAHAIATIAMSEAAAMSGDPEYRKAALDAARFIIKAQNPKTGGWRYRPYWEDKDKGDMSVVGWQVMALHSVSRLGLEIPEQTRRRTLSYIDSVTNRKGFSGYTGSRKVSPAMTAEAVFSRILLGDPPSKDQIRRAGDYILEAAPSRRNREKNFYFWYYASLALMQTQGPQWDRWNKTMRDHLVELQQQRGRDAGSFTPESRWGRVGGRTYSTATATLTLQVYYRYPSYLKKDQRAD